MQFSICMCEFICAMYSSKHNREKADGRADEKEFNHFNSVYNI